MFRPHRCLGQDALLTDVVTSHVNGWDVMTDVAVAQTRAEEHGRKGDKTETEWLSCLDLLDFNITCCNHDFNSTEIPPRLRLAIRLLSGLCFVFTMIQFIVGGMVSAFFAAKDGQVVQGCWWVGLAWLISSVAGANSQNKAHVMVAAVLSIVGVPIGIGGAASDGQAYFNYTDSPPLGCAQLTPQALPNPNPNDDGPAVSSARRFLRALQSASAPKTSKGGSGGLQITSYGPSPSSNAVAYSCLYSQYNINPADVSAAGTCVCTVAASELQSTGMECQQFILANSQDGNCGTIFSAYLPQLKASVGLSSFLIVLNIVIFFLCCIVLCTFVRKDSNSAGGGDGQDDIPNPQTTTTTTDRSTVFETFMVSPVKWLMTNPLHESDESQKNQRSSNTGGAHIAFATSDNFTKPDVFVRPQSSRLSFSNKAAIPQPSEAESPDLDDFQDAIEERPPSVVADQEEEEDDGRVSSSSTQTNAPTFSAGASGIAERYLGQVDIDSRSPETPRAKRSASVASKYLEAVGSASSQSDRQRATTTFK